MAAAAFRAALALYRGAGRLLAPLAELHFRRRAARGKEDPARLGERFGIPSLPRPEGPVVWVHAASVGESLSVLPLLRRALAERPALHAVVTTGTVTSAQLLAAQLPARASHQFMPLDLARPVERFLSHWRPDLVLWTESEFWPAAIAAAAAAGAPLVLLNGRMSARAFARWAWLRPLATALLDNFALCLAQSRLDERRLTALGARDVRCLGNLKWTAPPLAADEAELTLLAAAFGSRPRWLAASTHPGEETVVMEADRALRARHRDLLTIIVPRHPGRGSELGRQLRQAGARVALRSAGEAPDAATEIYLADTMGELGLWYRLAPVAFVGGSLVAHGGQNPLEPARLACAIVHGPHMANFAEIAAALAAADASREVRGAGELEAVLADLLFEDAGRRQAMTDRARAAVAEADGALDRVADALAPLLDPLAPRILAAVA